MRGGRSSRGQLAGTAGGVGAVMHMRAGKRAGLEEEAGAGGGGMRDKRKPQSPPFDLRRTVARQVAEVPPAGLLGKASRGATHMESVGRGRASAAPGMGSESRGGVAHMAARGWVAEGWGPQGWEEMWSAKEKAGLGSGARGARARAGGLARAARAWGSLQASRKARAGENWTPINISRFGCACGLLVGGGRAAGRSACTIIFCTWHAGGRASSLPTQHSQHTHSTLLQPAPHLCTARRPAGQTQWHPRRHTSRQRHSRTGHLPNPPAGSRCPPHRRSQPARRARQTPGTAPACPLPALCCRAGSSMGFPPRRG